VKCSRDVVISPDVALSSIDKDSFDVIVSLFCFLANIQKSNENIFFKVLPGGLGGAKAMAASSLVGDLLKHQEKSGKLIAAICASPALVLKSHEVGVGKNITCYPSFKDDLGGKFNFKDEIVVQDGKLITSQGPSTVFHFALKIVENLVDKETSEKVASGILLK
jgi:protein DJ-1